jgi:hypothetical protein
MKNKYLIVLILISFLFSCSKESRKETLYVNKIISAGKINNDNFLLSSIVDSVSFVPLETTGKSLIRRIDKLYRTDDTIFVSDCLGSNKVLVFDGRGRFIRTIGAVGNGPGEYIEMNDFCIDTLSRCLYFLTLKSVVYKYGYEGNFIEKFNLGFYSMRMEYNHGRLFFAGDPPPRRFRETHPKGAGYNLVVTDTSGRILYEEFPNEILGDNNIVLPHPFYSIDSATLYRISLDNHIYGIKKNNELFVHYYIDLGDNAYTIDAFAMNVPHKSYSEEDFFNILSKHTHSIDFIVENSKYALFFFLNKDDSILGIYDKKTEICNCYAEKNTVDDISGLSYELFPLFAYSYKDTFIAVLNSYDIVENFKDKPWFENLNIQEDSNPILYIVKTKND